MKTEIYTCDVKNCTNTEGVKLRKMQVVFETETTEGRSTDPYFDNIELDICPEHYQKLISERKVLSAAGAMGYNDYYIK